MKNKELYEGALRLLAEDPDADENEDYEERAPYLLAAFCGEAEALDRSIRRAEGMAAGKEFNPVWLPPEGEFPLSGRLSGAACLYLAAMLVMDEDPALSDRLYDRYSDAMATIATSQPAALEAIPDRYF